MRIFIGQFFLQGFQEKIQGFPRQIFRRASEGIGCHSVSLPGTDVNRCGKKSKPGRELDWACFFQIFPLSPRQRGGRPAALGAFGALGVRTVCAGFGATVLAGAGAAETDLAEDEFSPAAGLAETDLAAGAAALPAPGFGAGRGRNFGGGIGALPRPRHTQTPSM